MANLKITGREELIKKIISKKEFSQLPKKDVEKVFEKFDKEQFVDSEKVKLTRDLLRKMYSVFVSQKILNIKDKNAEWVLKKHMSTKERFDYYKEVYEKLLKGYKKINIFDLGCGVNGFSYKFFKNVDVNYIGVEAMGQLVEFMNYYFAKEKLKTKAIHESLFELEKIKKIISKIKGRRVVFLFKTLDSLEMIERDYSKKLLREIVPMVDKVVVSFATKSLIAKKNFNAQRVWFEKFVKEEFEILDDFEVGSERYVVFCK